MNINVPNTAATTQAVQVQGSTSLESRETALLREAIPSKRKSIIAIEPTTMVRAMTCRVSMIGSHSSVETTAKIFAGQGRDEAASQRAALRRTAVAYRAVIVATRMIIAI